MSSVSSKEPAINTPGAPQIQTEDGQAAEAPAEVQAHASADSGYYGAASGSNDSNEDASEYSTEDLDDIFDVEALDKFLAPEEPQASVPALAAEAKGLCEGSIVDELPAWVGAEAYPNGLGPAAAQAPTQALPGESIMDKLPAWIGDEDEADDAEE